MKDERRRKRKQKRVLILAAVLFVSIIIVVVGVYQSQQPQIKIEASEYFQIYDATINNGKLQPDGSVIIYDMSFKLWAMKGDAHDVIVRTPMYVDPENFPLIEQGIANNVTVSQRALNVGAAYQVRNQSGSLLFAVKILSKEASGTIVIDLAR